MYTHLKGLNAILKRNIKEAKRKIAGTSVHQYSTVSYYKGVVINKDLIRENRTSYFAWTFTRYRNA